MTDDLERRISALEEAVADLRRVVGTSEDWTAFAAGHDTVGDARDAAIAAFGRMPAPEGRTTPVQVRIEHDVYDGLAARAARVGVSVEVFALGILRLQCWPEERVRAVKSERPNREDYEARLRALAERRPIRGVTTDELMEMTRGSDVPDPDVRKAERLRRMEEVLARIPEPSPADRRAGDANWVLYHVEEARKVAAEHHFEEAVELLDQVASKLEAFIPPGWGQR